MSKNVQPVPPDFHSVTPHLVVSDAAAAIDFYKAAFGAEERFRMPAPDGARLLHAEIRIGDSPVMLASEFPEFGSKGPKTLGGSPVALHLYVADVDAAYDRAVTAGFTTGSVTPASTAKPHCATCLRSRSSHGRRTSANRPSLAAASRGRSAWCLTWPGPASPALRPGPARTGSPPPRHRPPEHRLRGESCWFSVPL